MHKLNNHASYSSIYGIICNSPVILMLFICFSILFLPTQYLNAQTQLEGGDIALLGVNANSFACGGSSGNDVITFVAFKDLTNNTEIDVTDNGWERVNAGLWGDSEGAYRLTRTGGTITAGTSFEIIFDNDLSATQAANPGWTITDINVPSTLNRTVNFNSGGDQLYVMQSGDWLNGGETGEHDADYDGKILYGFNTRTFWAANGTTQQSNLHPAINPCYFMNPTSGTTNYVNYTGPTTAVTQLEWINLIGDPSNWTTYTSCSAYDANPPPSLLPISPSGMSIECSVCTGCGTVNDVLTFNLPTTGGPFNVVYSDGVSAPINLGGISNLHTENVTVTTTTTFSLISVTDVNGCPVFSNFDGDATISLTGGGGSASIAGGGVICTGNCSDIDVTIAGGQAPYDVTMELDFPPFVNNWEFDVDMPTTNLNLTICVDGLLPNYDPLTNTLTIPDFIGNNITITLIDMVDNGGCAGTVDPTPLNFDIQQTPTANPAGPLQACDDGSGMATFDLTALDITVNGGNGNMVSWYSDMALNSPIGNPDTYSSGNNTVYATTTQGDCESDPIAVNLEVDATQTPSPAADQACDNGSGMAIFDLTSLDNIINSGSGNPVSWYFDNGGLSSIPTPDNFSTGTITVFATITVGICESGTVAVQLTVTPAPSANSTSMQACDEGGGFATFDLTTLDIIVNGGTGNSVSWYTDISGNIDIPDPTNHATTGGTVYANVDNGFCTSPIVNIVLTVNPSPVAIPTSNTACDEGGGSASFDLTLMDFVVNGGTGNSVTWFINSTATVQVPNPTDFPSTGGSVWATVNNGFCDSEIVEIILAVSPAPTATTTTGEACDEGGGLANFDLTTLDNTINGGNGMTVNWYLDMGGLISIPDPTDFTSSGISVYAEVDNGACASSIVEIVLTVNPAPIATTTTAEACDDGFGSATFNLTTLDIIVNGGNGMTVNWYFNMDGSFPIPDPNNFTTSIDITVYASVSNGVCESLTANVDLSIIPTPQVNPTSDEACDDGTGTATFDLTTLDNIVNGGTGNPVSWFSDINGNFPIPDPTSVISGSGSFFTCVSIGNCNSPIIEILVTVLDQPTANPTSAQACDDGSGSATFNLTDLDAAVGAGNTVTWYDNATATNEIVNPADFNTGATSVFAIVTDGNCNSEIVEIILTIEDQIIANPTSAQACDDGSGSAAFNLTDLDAVVGAGNTVTWYDNATATNEIVNPADFNTGATSVFAIVTDGDCNSEIVEIILTIEDQIIANPTSAQACDDGSGTAAFNLTDLDAVVGAGNTVTWYDNATATNEIADPADFNTGATSVFAIVTDGNCNSEIVEIILTIEDQITANPTSAQACDDGSGSATFNLTDLDAVVGAGNTVTWYDNATATNEIVNSADFNTGATSVFAIVTDGNCNSEIVEIILTIEDQISANPTSAQACDDGSGSATFNLTDLDAVVGAGNTVTWYDNATATNTIADPADFNTGATSVFAIVTDGDCNSEIVEIVLTIEDQITANPTSAQACDDGSGSAAFNLTDLDAVVGAGNTVTWYDNATATNEIADPSDFNTGATSVFAIVTDGDCNSEIVEIILTIEDQITANPTSAQACDDGSGTAAFNLTDLDGVVGAGNTVTWYDNATATNEIADPSDFNTGATSVFAIVTDGDCNSEIVEIILTIEDQITANPTSAQACDDGSGTAAFNLTDLDGVVGAGNTVTWYDNATATNEIADPSDFNTGATSVFAIVTDGDCNSEIVEIILTIEDQITANPTSAQACDDGSGTAAFNLTDLDDVVGAGNTVTWYDNATATNQIADPADFNTGATSVFAIVTDGDCVSEIVEIILTIEDQITANPTSAQACDDGSGSAAFNLTDLDGVVGAGNTVTWYDNATATNEIADPSDFNTGATSVFAIVTDGDCVSEIVEIVLTIENQISANPTSAQACDDGSGTAAFNLTDLDGVVGAGNTVTWYDNATATNEIADPSDFNTGATSVFAIVTDGDCVSEIVEIVLTIENQISANPTSAQACDDGSGTAAFNLTDLDGVVGAGNTVTWFDNATATNEIADPADFNTGATSVFAIVTDGDCVSEIVEIVLTIENQISANPTSAQACDDGSGTAAFNLTDLDGVVGAGNTVTWYDNATATNEIVDPSDFNTGATSVFAIVTDGDCVSEIVEIILTIEDQISANPTSAQACDDGSGSAAFNLTDLDGVVGAGNTVTWYDNATATNEIADPSDFNTGATSVFAIVTDGDCVSEIVEIVLTIENQISANPTSAQACDDGSGTAAFNLTDLDGVVGAGNTVTWYDNATATNEIADPMDFNTGATSVFAIVTDGDCVSEIVEIILTIENQISANPTSAQACDDGSGSAAFNLTDLDGVVGAGNTVTWYDNATATNEIADPADFNTGATSVFAIVTDGDCVSEIVEIILTIENQILANPTSAQACDDGSGSAAFNLTDLDGVVGAGNTVTWYDNATATNEIADPADFNTAATSVFAIVTDGDCVSEIVEIVLTIENQISANPTSAQACDDGSGTAAFNLTDLDGVVGAGNTVTWYDNATATNEIADPADFNTAATSVFAIVTDGDCVSEIVEIVLTIENQISANPTSAQACDDGSGTAAFNLTDLDGVVGAGNTVTWYDNATATNEIADPSDFNTGATSVFAIVTDGDCVSEIVEIILTIEDEISANPTSAQACDDGSGSAAFNLTDLDGVVGAGNTVTWYDNATATNEIADPADFNTGATSVFAIVTDGDCVSEIVEIILTIEDEISANPTSAQACDDGSGSAAFNLTDLDGVVGAGNTVTWYDNATATNEIADPSDFNTGATSVFAIVTDGDCVSEIVEIILTIENQISANPTSAQACDDGSGTAAFNLTDLDGVVGAGNTVTWYDNATATNEIADPSDFNTGATSVFAIVTDGDCVSEIVEIILTIENQISANPTSAQACDDGSGSAAFNLTDLDGVVGAGNTVTWYDNATATNEIVDPSDFNTGATSVFAIVTDGDCVSEIVEIVLTIEDQISANPTSAQACDDGSGTAAFNLTDLDGVVGAGNTVTWYDNATATSEIADPADFNTAATSVFAIVTDGDCVSEIVEIVLTIENQISANPTSAQACDDGSGTAAFNLTNLDGVVGAGNTVTWYDNATATNEIVDPSDFNTGATSVFAIVTDGDCVSEIVEIVLTIENQITANPTSAQACDDGSGSAAFNLTDLDGVVGAGNTVTWYDNATATNEIADPADFNTGATSVFAIVTDGDCLSEIVEIILTIENQISANPTSAQACDDGSGTAAFNLTDLDGVVGAGNTVTWYDNATATNEIVDPADFNTAATSVFAIVTDGDCLSEIVEIILTIENQITANPTSAQACDDGSGTAAFNLTDLDGVVGAGNTVTWYDNATATNEIANPMDFNTGATSVFAIVTDGDCVSEIVEIILTIENQISANPTSAQACDDGSGSAAFNLTDLDGVVGAGNTVTWYDNATATNEIADPSDFNTGATSVFAIVTDGDCASEIVEIDLGILSPTSSDYIDLLCEDENVIINGTTYDINLPSGIETFTGSNGCDSIVDVDLSFYEPIIGNIIGNNDICSGQSTTITFNLNGANAYDVIYTEGSNPPVTLNNIFSGHTINVSPNTTTTYTLDNVIGINVPCSSTIPNNSVTINVTSNSSALSILSDFQGYSISCNGENDGSVEAIPLDGTAPYSFLWNTNETSSSLENIAAGIYSVTITDNEGCTSESSIALTEPPALLLSTQTLSPECFGDSNGAIIIDTIEGIASPFEFSLDGEFFNTIPAFPYTLPSLGSGNYELTIQDMNDCIASQNVSILSPNPTTVDLGNDLTISLGESIQLGAFVSPNVDSFIWNRPDLGCIDCLDPYVMPMETSEYSITVIDTFGCTATDDIIVFVKKDRNVFIPSAFSPNGDGDNDWFFVYADQSVVNISKFRIFSRWGETVYSAEDIAPNVSSLGWNGEFKGERLNPGVFVYLIELEFLDGRVQMYKGDVTIVK